MLLEGAGLANVLTANDPKLFTDPQSLSFERIDVSTGPQRTSLLLTATDAGDGSGTWTVSLAPQAASAGVVIDVPGRSRVAPGAMSRFRSSFAPPRTRRPARTTASSCSPATG